MCIMNFFIFIIIILQHPMDQSILTTSIKLNDVDESNLWSSIIEKKNSWMSW